MSEDYEGISSLLKGMFSSPEARRSMSANQRAAYVWHNVNRARLSLGGLEVSELVFIVSQFGHGAAPRTEHVSGAAAAATPKTPLPELTGSEQDAVKKLAESVPESLRGSVYKAMSLSFRREKSRDTNDGTSRP